MLLVGTRAVDAILGGEMRADAPWELWVTRETLSPENSLIDAKQAFEAGEGGTTWLADGREYQVRWIAPADPRRQVMACNRNAPTLDNGQGWEIRIACPQTVALILRAELYLSNAWHRRIEDYHRLLARLPMHSPDDELLSACQAVRAAVMATVDAKQWTMRISNEEFFTDFKYPYLRSFAHDDLHRATCYGERPLYEMLKENPDEAYIPKAAFERLCPDDRVRLAREEAYALGLERVLVPAFELGVNCPEARGFLHALRRLSTSLARGWFRDFIIDHYPSIYPYDKSILQDFHRALDEGRLRRCDVSITRQERRRHLQAYWESLCDKDRAAAMPFDESGDRPPAATPGPAERRIGELAGQ